LRSYEETQIKRDEDVLRNPGRIALESRVHGALPQGVPVLLNGAIHD
jgi:hypothetical protein